MTSESQHDFSAAGARYAADCGQLESWVHEYLLGPGGNLPFSEGLKRRTRYWRDPELLPLRVLRRTCGPEPDMPFRESLDAWHNRVSAIVSSFRELEHFPPLIAQYDSGGLVVNDGSHRLAAFEAHGLVHCWVIVWYGNETEFEHHKRIGFAIAAAQ